MPNPAPVAAINEWSCALACVSWHLARNQIKFSQDELVCAYGLYFPEWFFRKGLLNRGDILSLLERTKLPFRKFYHLKNKVEILDVINANFGADGVNYLAGFIITRKPTNHCLAIDSWNHEHVIVMDPSPANPRIESLPWDNLIATRDVDVLWLFK